MKLRHAPSGTEKAPRGTGFQPVSTRVLGPSAHLPIQQFKTRLENSHHGQVEVDRPASPLGRHLLMLLALLALVIPSRILTAAEAGDVRQTINLNPGWKFIREDVPGAEAPAFDDAARANVDLPHTWNNFDGEDGGNNYYRGPGWYRKHLRFDESARAGVAGKSLFIRFGAACFAADVYVNGKQTGSHKGGFSAFCFDVTPLLNPAADNLIAVRVTNAHDDTIPPISADFTFFGGLYRGAQLLVLDPLSVTPLDDASSGVYVRQEIVAPDRADLHVAVKLRNARTAAAKANVTCELVDDGGKIVASADSKVEVPPAGVADVMATMPVDRPHLWDGRRDPYLYRMRVTVRDGDAATDRVVEPVGLRFFAVDPDAGFSLNGKPYALHGVNRHQDRIDKGWAIGPAEQKEDFDLIMEMGCTGVRLSHYQHAPEFYDLCDRGGLVVWAEACLVNNVGPSEAFDQTCQQQLRELIKQSYNHPSICFWSLYNELNPRKIQGKDETDHQIALIEKLNGIAHELDPGRLTTAAALRQAHHPLSFITDVIAFNRYFGWYNGKLSDWPAALDKLKADCAGHCVGIGEYGCGASIVQHEPDPVKQPKPGATWHPEEWQCALHEAVWPAMSQRPWLWGEFIWCMFDFASDGRKEGDHPGRNDKGLVTYDRKTKKDAFYYYKANWSAEPVVYIVGRRFTPRHEPRAPIKVYSNAASVELKVNGKSLGSKSAAAHVFVWSDVELSMGENNLEATGTTDGRAVTSDRCTIVREPGAPDARPDSKSSR